MKTPWNDPKLFERKPALSPAKDIGDIVTNEATRMLAAYLTGTRDRPASAPKEIIEAIVKVDKRIRDSLLLMAAFIWEAQTPPYASGPVALRNKPSAHDPEHPYNLTGKNKYRAEVLGYLQAKYPQTAEDLTEKIEAGLKAEAQKLAREIQR